MIAAGVIESSANGYYLVVGMALLGLVLPYMAGAAGGDKVEPTFLGSACSAAAFGLIGAYIAGI